MREQWSQLPFGWVCFSNMVNLARKYRAEGGGLNCLSAGSVSLTPAIARRLSDLEHDVSIAFRLGLFL